METGADPRECESCLIRVVKADNLGGIKLLVESGMKLMDYNLEDVVDNEYLDVINYIVGQGVRSSGCLYSAIGTGNLCIVQEIANVIQSSQSLPRQNGSMLLHAIKLAFHDIASYVVEHPLLAEQKLEEANQERIKERGHGAS